MRFSWSRSPLVFPFVCLIGCGSSGGLDWEVAGAANVGSPIAMRQSAVKVSEVRVRADGLTVWLDEVALPTLRSGTLQVSLRGRSSANLTAVSSFVPDDAFGRAVLIGPRSFEITLRDGHEINTILSGLPLFLSLSLHSGKTYGAKLSLASRLTPTPGPVAIDPLLRPVYFRDPGSSLRYRGLATSSSTLRISTLGGVDPWLSSFGSGRYQFDWAYAGVAQLIDDASDRVLFTTGSTAQTSALELVVRDLGLVLGDAATAWPTPRCQRPVYDCVSGLPGATRDYGVCGSYREVSRCMGVDVCDVVPTPPVAFSLRSRAATGLATAVKTAHDACPRTGGSWCSVGPAMAFDHPRCLAMPPDLTSINEEAIRQTDRSGAFDPRYGIPLSRAALAMTQTFRTGLLTAIDAFAGDTDLRATQFEAEEPCHNCHQFALKFVLYYPRTHTVVVVDGSYGYDS